MVFIAQLYIVKILCMIAIGVLMSKKIRVSKFVLLNFILILVYGVLGTGLGIIYQNPNPFQFLGVFSFGLFSGCFLFPISQLLLTYWNDI